MEILRLYDGQSTRNLLLRITDPGLLETTGGIVQGMWVIYNRDNTGKSLDIRAFPGSPL